MKSTLLFISTIFPNKLTGQHATYTLQSLQALKGFFDIDIINPLPWRLKITNRIAFNYTLDGLNIYHPTYWYPPRVLRSYYGIFYYLSIQSCVTKLIKIRRPDVIYSSWLYPDGWVACKIANLLKIPSIVRAIGTDANRLVVGSDLARKSVETVAYSKKVECVSESLRSKLLTVGADPSKLFVLYNGVNRDCFYKMDKISLRSALGYGADDVLIMFVGNLLQTKGLDELAESFKSLKNIDKFKGAKLIIAGTGAYETNFRNRLKSAGIINDTIFKGSCALPEVAKLMNVADVVCLPSYSEGLPNVILEALCCNAKIVATGVGGIPELAHRHQNLYLVPPRNSERLSSALATAILAKCTVDPAEDIRTWSDYANKLLEYM